MTNHETPARVTAIYEAIDAFQRTHRLPGLQHAQIRGLLAEHLARALPAAVSVPPPAPQAADRRARYAAAIADGFRAFDADTTSDAYLDAELLDAVVAVADAEEAELLAAVPVVPPALRADDRAALDRVRALHQPIDGDGGPYCQTCTQDEEQPHPVGWWMPFPCPTVQVVDEELRRLADEAQQPDDGEGDELVCVDECGFCDACGYEPFGTPAEGWREAARFLRRTARDSGDRAGALHGARLIEAELRRLADESGPCVAGEQQPECAASISGNCLREGQSETACDTEAGECVHGGRPAGEQQNETPETETPTTTKPETEAHPPHSRWYVETYDHLADEWAPGMRFGERAEAVARYETVCRNHPTRTDGSPACRRFVRETTTYTVEPAVRVRQDGAQPE